jgi:aspartyl-tRNA(Asn)/glutamyl-tRNA(Gln) amidotransferase subunit C
MTLSIQEVEHIAELARLRLSPEEIARYREQLSDILEYAARLQSVDTTGVPLTSSVFSSRRALRADAPRPGLPLQSLLGNAPQTEDGQFRVPAILE